jgi:ParB family transcriptional regulator, chromosome partitioning protein
VARKHLLTGLAGPELPAGNLAAPSRTEAVEATANFGGGRGAIGAVSRSIEQIKSHSIVDLATHLIDNSFIEDRIEVSPEDQAHLTASIREHGQQVPILVRPHPSHLGRYQIAYGHRRLKAAAELGRTVRAVVKPLTDEQLVVAQGQENNARTDLSFIEKALFAAQLEAKGFGRETIMAAICIDKTGLSRLITSAVKIPRDIIVAIGSSPKSGRDRWSELSTRLERPQALAKARATIEDEAFARKDSDERFKLVFQAAAPKAPQATRPTVCHALDGTKLAQIRDEGPRISVVIDKKATPEFGSYLVEVLPRIYAEFKGREEA